MFNTLSKAKYKYPMNYIIKRQKYIMLCSYHPDWWLMRLGYRTCFHTLYDEKKKSKAKYKYPMNYVIKRQKYMMLCCYHPGWRLMRQGYRTCFHTLYDEKKSKAKYKYPMNYVIKRRKYIMFGDIRLVAYLVDKLQFNFIWFIYYITYFFLFNLFIHSYFMLILFLPTVISSIKCSFASTCLSSEAS